jgi:FixJ family two-component response regulator
VWCFPQAAHRLFIAAQRWNEHAFLHVGQSCSSDAGLKLSVMNSSSLVSVVDDDESVRESLPDLLNEFGFASQTFSSAEEFLASNGMSRTRCLILDVAMPGMGGPELQQELKRRKIGIPIIFITGRRDDAVESRVIQQGAIACLIKPFSDSALLDALNSALPVK